MPQTIQRKRRQQESIFPGLDAFAVFLEEIERLAPECGVNSQNTRRLVKFLRAKFGKGLRRETFASAAR